MASKDPKDLHERLRPLYEKWHKKCIDSGLDARLLMTYRTPAEQDRFYAQGRTLPGKIITSLKGSASKHCHTMNGKPAAKAFDFGIFEGGKYITNGSDWQYERAGVIGEELGLTWGGRWTRPFDPSHLELKV